ncbi:MAG: serine/threonine-protein kinase [Polyangiales bacterium]
MLSSAAEDRSRSIGRYEVLGELGHGGMAVVYRARDSQLLREVAVKVLHPHLSSDVESRQRFLREAQAAARLRHPNIVEVFDFSVEADRESFMVTELLDGPTLRRFAEGRWPLPAEVVAAIGVVLCDALSCAHAQGVVHRDVKPDNILLHKGMLKLTDFGIAHVADGNGMTVTGQILGSPAHMAPEQIDAGPVDARTDLFSLGTVLYVLAVGRLPFEAPVAHALLRKILEADYVDPVRAEPTVGERFAVIIRRCMARRIDDRYKDAAELRKALCEFCAEVGWDEPAKKLTEYFSDPEAFTEAHKALLLEVLPERGRKARDAKRVPEAMAYFNRALAIDPTNVKVVELVRSVARRRQRERMMRGAALVTVTAATSALVVVGAVKAVRSRGPAVSPDTSSQRSGSLTNAAREAGVSLVQNTVHSATNIAIAASANADAAVASASASEAADAGAATRVAQRIEPRVRLVLRGITGRLAIDGAEPLAFASDFEHRLSVGAHEIQVLPNDPQCERPALWRVDVRPGVAGAVQELPSPMFTCHPQNGSTSARGAASANARSGANIARASATASNENVNVRLIVLGLQGLVSIDGRDPREHDNGNEYALAPGPHTVQVIPADPSCARPAPWPIEVTPTPEGTPLRLTSRRYACLPR